MTSHQKNCGIDLKKLSTITRIPLGVLEGKYKERMIDENFDVDAFIQEINQMQDDVNIEENEECEEQEIIQQNEGNCQLDDSINKQIDEIMKNEKQDEINGVGKISFKYKQLKKVDYGLSSDEFLTLNEVVLDYLVKNGRVDLSVYKRLKEDNVIKGEKFDVSKVKPYMGRFEPLKRHQRMQLEKDQKLQIRQQKNKGYWQKRRLH